MAALYEADPFRKGNTGAKISYKVLRETDYSDEKGYCINWSKGTVSARYEFRTRRYALRISFDHDGKPHEVEARCSHYADGLPANLECDRRVMTFRFGAPERREAGWGIDNEQEAVSRVTIWSHNGSAMELRADGALRSFSYLSPRPGLQPYGVYPGTLCSTDRPMVAATRGALAYSRRHAGSCHIRSADQSRTTAHA